MFSGSGAFLENMLLLFINLNEMMQPRKILASFDARKISWTLLSQWLIYKSGDNWVTCPINIIVFFAWDGVLVIRFLLRLHLVSGDQKFVWWAIGKGFRVISPEHEKFWLYLVKERTKRQQFSIVTRIRLNKNLTFLVFTIFLRQ